MATPIPTQPMQANADPAPVAAHPAGNGNGGVQAGRVAGALGAGPPAQGARAPVPASTPTPANLAPAAGQAMETPGDAESLLHLTPAMARLPVAMSVTVPVREFRVRNLLAMAPGTVIETQWEHGEDLPLASGDVQLAWSEFEVVDSRLAVRVTRLA